MSAAGYDLVSTSLHYGELVALRGVSVTLPPGELVAIAGPNGAGKSTLLNILARLRPDYGGVCHLRGREVRSWSRREFARTVSVVPQGLQLQFPFTAEQVVLMGRTPFADSLFESPEDAAHVTRALQLTGTEAFRHRPVTTLSGGERQRVILAAALAQTPEVLLLDEPTTYLDPEHQVSLYRLLRSLAREGLLVVTVTHDLNLAATFADRILLLRSGQLFSDGPPAEVLQPDTLHAVFHVHTLVEAGPSGRPRIHYGDEG